jgi:TonB family protein
MMKASLLFTFCFCIALILTKAQDTSLTWMNYAKETVSKDDARLYRLVWQADSLWRVNDYYLNDTLEMMGSFESPELEVKTGEFIFYYRDGTISHKCFYKDNYMVGPFEARYPEGHISVKGNYAVDLSREERLTINARDDKSEDSLSVKEGVWIYYHFNGRVSAKKDYDQGILFSETYWEDDGSNTPQGTQVDKMPEFPGGSDAMMRFLGENIMYPEEEKNKGISGKVICGFTIDRLGNIQNAHIVESVSPGFDSEVLRVVNIMPQWEPGKQENRNVEMEYELPVGFSFKGGRPKKKK